MIPTRQKMIGKNKVEEYRSQFAWAEEEFLIVYINGKVVVETYDQAVARLEREE